MLPSSRRVMAENEVQQEQIKPQQVFASAAACLRPAVRITVRFSASRGM